MVTDHNCVFGDNCPYEAEAAAIARRKCLEEAITDEEIFQMAANKLRTLHGEYRGYPVARLLPLLAVVMEDAAKSAWSPGTPERRNLLILAREILSKAAL